MRKSLLVAGAALVAATWTMQAQATQGVTPTEVVIGNHLDLSGPIVFWGVPQRNGHIMGAEEINADGGIHGRKIRLVIEDNGYDPKKAVLAVQKLLQQDKVFTIVGALGTPVVSATLPAVLEAGVPHLFPGAMNKAMYEPFNKLMFALAAPYEGQVKAGVRHFAGKKKRIAVIFQDDDFGKDIREAAVAQAKASGMEVVAEASYKRGETAFSSQVARVRQGNPDLIMLGTVPRETVGIMAEARKLGWNVDFLAPASACNQAVADLGKANTEGAYILCQYAPLDFDNEPPAVKAWMVRYEKRFGTKADVSAAMTYDMQKLTALALERAGKDLTTEKFLAALETIKNWQSIFGAPPLTFSRDNHVGTRTAVLTQITNGKFKRITGPLQ